MAWPYRPAIAGRLPADNPAPLQIAEPHLAPDGSRIAAGTWIVLYQPIIY